MQLGVDGLRGLENFNVDSKVRMSKSAIPIAWYLISSKQRHGVKLIAGYEHPSHGHFACK